MFEKINFNTLFTPDFKEDAVKEVLILPIIQRLGYAQNQVMYIDLLIYFLAHFFKKNVNIL